MFPQAIHFFYTPCTPTPPRAQPFVTWLWGAYLQACHIKALNTSPQYLPVHPKNAAVSFGEGIHTQKASQYKKATTRDQAHGPAVLQEPWWPRTPGAALPTAPNPTPCPPQALPTEAPFPQGKGLIPPTRERAPLKLKQLFMGFLQLCLVFCLGLPMLTASASYLPSPPPTDELTIFTFEKNLISSFLMRQ